MPRKKDSNANNRQLEKQVAVLKKQLEACQKEIAKHTQKLKEAANIGYEMGCIEAEEREISRAKVVAEAIARFEQKHAKAGRGSVLERAAKKSVVAKKSAKKVKAKAKPAKAKKAAAKPAKAVAKPAVKPAAKVVRQPKRPAQPAPQEAEVAEIVMPAQEPSEIM
jgi:hypothetical protein